METTENNKTKKISTIGFVLFMGVIGICIGGFTLVCYYYAPNVPASTKEISPIVMFLIGYIPCQLGAIPFLLAARKTGYKDGISIR